MNSQVGIFTNTAIDKLTFIWFLVLQLIKHMRRHQIFKKSFIRLWLKYQYWIRTVHVSRLATSSLSDKVDSTRYRIADWILNSVDHSIRNSDCLCLCMLYKYQTPPSRSWFDLFNKSVVVPSEAWNLCNCCLNDEHS